MNIEQLMQIVGNIMVKAEELDGLGQEGTLSQPEQLICLAEARGLRNAAELVGAWISEQRSEMSVAATLSVCRQMARVTEAIRQGTRGTIGYPAFKALRHEMIALQTSILSGHGDDAQRARVREIKALLSAGPLHQDIPTSRS